MKLKRERKKVSNFTIQFDCFSSHTFSMYNIVVWLQTAVRRMEHDAQNA